MWCINLIGWLDGRVGLALVKNPICPCHNNVNTLTALRRAGYVPMWEFFIYKTGGEVALKLNARQKAFCEYYVASGNATEAAIKAGYSERTAKSIGQRLLTFVDIKKYIDELMQKLESERIATAEEVLQNLTAMMRGEIQEEVIVVEGEGEGVSSARIIKKQVSAKDRIKAAELLGKRHALFTDKTKIEGTLPVMIVGEDDLDE
jgi:terminase small subunit